MHEEVRLVFHCAYCNRVSVNKGAMVVHEKHCKKNPANIPRCWECYWFEETFFKEHIKYIDPAWDECCPWNGKRECEISVSICKISDKKMFWKVSKAKEQTLIDAGWEKCPMRCDKCEHFLSYAEAHKISSWYAKTTPGSIKLTLTPEKVKRYYEQLH